MHIFIDEAGTFAGYSKFPSVSLVGALVIPDKKLPAIERKYQTLRLSLPKHNGEVKGRLLNEDQVAKVVDLLRMNEALFETTVVDLGIHTETDVRAHKAGQAQGFTNQLTPEHHENARQEMWRLRRQLEEMSLPLYVQSEALFDLIYRTIEHAGMYFSQRQPKELAHFHWVIDAKEVAKKKTHWEEWWSYVVMPALQTKSLYKPLVHLSEGDYSHFERFSVAPSEYLQKFATEPEKLMAKSVNLNLLLTEHFRFSSACEYGLELVDIITNSTRRALVGNLKFEGWRHIPRTMVHRKQHYIQIVSLMSGQPSQRKYPYQEVLRHFEKGGRSMLAPRFLK